MGRRLLQVVLGQVNRELGDEGRAAPVGTYAGWLDRRDVAEAGRGMVAREGVAVALIQIRIEVAQVKRELLPGKRDADIPVGVALKGNAAREGRYSIEAIGGSQEPMTNVGRDEPADPVRQDCRQNIFRRAGEIGAVSA